jgi:hypothetical protein
MLYRHRLAKICRRYSELSFSTPDSDEVLSDTRRTPLLTISILLNLPKTAPSASVEKIDPLVVSSDDRWQAVHESS